MIENKDQIIRDLNKHVRQAIAHSPDKSKEIKETGTGIQKMAMRKSKLIDIALTVWL